MVDTSVPNSVSLITGAASGIGRHLAIHASNLGHDVVLIDLDANGLDETKKLCSKAETFCIDVGNSEQMVEVKEALDKKNINVNFLFNNAGIFIEGRSWKTSPEMWNKIISTNLLGITNALNVLLDQMLKTDTKGHIVNTASMAGVIVGGFLAPYTATKHAVVGLSRSLYEELKETNANIGVSVLCPGVVQSQIIENERPLLEINQDDLDEDENAKLMKTMLSEGVRNGLEPSVVAERVFEAIDKEEFWIFTHQEFADTYKEYSQEILDSMNS